MRKGTEHGGDVPELKPTLLYTYTERDNFFPAHVRHETPFVLLGDTQSLYRNCQSMGGMKKNLTWELPFSGPSTPLWDPPSATEIPAVQQCTLVDDGQKH
jgi:hypothetical protein